MDTPFVGLGHLDAPAARMDEHFSDLGNMAGEHREAMAILTALKRSFDPDDIMNPGKLGLAARRWEAR